MGTPVRIHALGLAQRCKRLGRIPCSIRQFSTNQNDHDDPYRFISRIIDPKELLDGLVLPGKAITRDIPEIWNAVGGPQIPCKLKNFQSVASFSWMGFKENIMIVPGLPNRWRPEVIHELPFDLQLKHVKNRPSDIINENLTRCPDFPLAPIIAAVNYVNPHFDWSKIDIVININMLRHICHWLSDHTIIDFRLDLQLSRSGTVLSSQRDCYSESNNASSEPSFGLSLEEKCTEPFDGFENAGFHYKVITYDLEGVRVLTWFQVDACINSRIWKDRIVPVPSPRGRIPLAQDLIPHAAKVVKGPASPIHILTGGYLVPHSDLVEIKGVSLAAERLYKDDRVQVTIVQSYFRQLEHLYVAMHQNQLYSFIGETDFKSQEIRTHAFYLNSHLRQTGNFLRWIVKRVRKAKSKTRRTLICGGDRMSLHERNDTRELLPPDLLDEVNFPMQHVPLSPLGSIHPLELERLRNSKLQAQDIPNN